jgi:RNA polymerase sigma factor (sigma-70 family)
VTYPSRDQDVDLVVAAQAGDGVARNDLARRYLPLVYNLVRQGLADDADVDDVVQDVMVRALRQLPELRRPDSFRPWLAAIAVHQVGTHLARRQRTEHRTTSWETAADLPDAGADLEGPALLRAELARQRRQAGHATHWMGADERAAYSLWWLETVGELSRTEMARALRAGAAHTRVRIQRMREQLELSRKIVAALEALPGCAELATVVADWDGAPTSFWRKRIGRHVRSCPVCGQATRDLLPAERLFVGLALLPVPLALATAVFAKGLTTGAASGAGVTAASGAAAWLGRLAQVVGAHPVVATVSAGVLTVGVSVPAVEWTTLTPPARAVAVAPARVNGSPLPLPLPSTQSTGLLQAGRVSLESSNDAGSFITVADDRVVLTPVSPASDAVTRQRATLDVVAGLADPACFSFRGQDGRYLRHSSFRLRTGSEDGTVLFRRDATFCARTGPVDRSITLESFNFPGFFLRHIRGELWIDQFDGAASFRAESAFRPHSPLA